MFFGVQKHRFYPPKDGVWHPKSIAFVIQNLYFGIFNAHFWPNKRKFFSKWRKWFVTKKENQKCSQTLKKLRFESNLKGKRAKKWKGKLKRIKVKKWKGERVFWMKDERIRMKDYVLFCLLPPTFTYFALPYLPK